MSRGAHGFPITFAWPRGLRRKGLAFPRQVGVTRIGGCVYLRAAAIRKLLPLHPLASFVRGISGSAARRTLCAAVLSRGIPHHVSL
jgi:hypothetical protein